MELKCYGWYENNRGELTPNFPLDEKKVLIINNQIFCEKNCRYCLFDRDDLKINCPGLRDDGEWRFSFTTRQAKRENGEENCETQTSEGKCPICLLKLRRNSGR